MSMPPAQPAHAEERPPKRTKIRLACQECRDRKIRCDGGRPTCNACARKKLGPEHCIYIEPHNEVAPSYVRSLESRIRELEERPDRDRGFIRKRIPQAQTGVPFSTPHSQTPTQQDHAQMKDPKGYPCSSPLRRYDGERSLPSIHNVLGSDYPSHLNHRQQSAPLNAQNGPNTESPFPGAYASPEPPYRSDSFNVEQRRNASPLHGQTGSLSAFQPDLGGIIHEQKSRAAADNPEIEDTLPNSHSDEALEAQRASAMGATAGTPPSATVTGSVFLGPSSAAAFMKEVQKTSSVWKRTHSDFVGDGVASSTASRASRPRSRKEKELVRTLMEELVLPPRRVADAHLNNYWKHVYPLYPILHKPSFMKR
ncbi:hypothetical protein BU26DRAFT_565121 [Trematosphaeria pertusa]|uniref:Zn(2)-C6 fungal-type domain-containing protein n=1 Tax=Trematosphaeria pertusa TaxID=390896 RepID=A0A6A6IFX0_9PLEO|nr:uncharacterized protein BU26DRAFT_565121 [Trematosphaeria pertusa]KAF2249475.1 hypothetical protein BU26DRAFT_565121 [Trematosphaeria pertusa]